MLIAKPQNRAIRSNLRSLSTICGDRCAACTAHALPHGARPAALAAIARTTGGASSTATKLILCVSVLMRCSANSFASAYLYRRILGLIPLLLKVGAMHGTHYETTNPSLVCTNPTSSG